MKNEVRVLRRIFAVIMSIVTMFVTMVSATGCSTKTNNSFTMGLWLSMIDDAFGMNSYTSEEPYFVTVSADSPYFAAAQIAAEWNVIPKDADLDINKNVTWKDALIILVNCGSFTAEDATDDEKIEYGIEHFDSTIKKYWMSRNISQKDATALLATAQGQWASKTFDEKIESVTFAEGVKDYSQGEEKLDTFTYDEDTDLVTIPLADAPELNDGDVFVLPAGAGLMGTSAFKVESVQNDGKNVYVRTSDDVDLYDIAQDLYSADTFTPTAENMVIRDPDGNILFGENTAAEYFTGEGMTMLSNPEGGIMPTLSMSGSKTFKVNGWDFELSTKFFDGKPDIGIKVTTPNLLNLNKTKAEIAADNSKKSLTLSGGFNISDIKVTHEFDYSWFTLHSAEVRVDYDTTATFSVTGSKRAVNKVVAPEKQNWYSAGGMDAFWNNLQNSVIKDATAAGAKSIKTGYTVPESAVMKIASMDVYNGGVARVTIDINLQVKIDGTFTISLNVKGSNGLEYKNNNLRFIKTCDKDLDASLKVKVEATVGIGPALYILKLKKKVVGVEARVGVGASYTNTFHIVDSGYHELLEKQSDLSDEAVQFIDNYELTADQEVIKEIAEKQGCTYTIESSTPAKLHLDVCTDVTVYFILSLGLSTDSYARDLLKNVKLTLDVFNEKNGKMINIHFDNDDMKIGFFTGKEDLCTLKYKPFDPATQDTTDASDATTEAEETETFAPIIEGDSIVLSEIYTTMSVDGKYYTNVLEVPRGYSLSDLTIISDDPSIVAIDENGVAVAKAPGSTMLTVKTKDDKFSAYIAVDVLSFEEKQAMSPLVFSGKGVFA